MQETRPDPFRSGAGGVLAHLQGGKFGNAFFAAGVTKWASPAVSSIGMGDGHQSFADLTAQTVVAATVGGTASVIAGGSFGNGAQTAAFQYLFNQVVSGNQTLISTTNMRNQQPRYNRQFTEWEDCFGPLRCADPVNEAPNGSIEAFTPEEYLLGAVRVGRGLGALAGGAAPWYVRIRLMGDLGDNAVRWTYAIGPRTGIKIGSKWRYPDGLNSTAISEIKNVARQDWDAQLRAYSAYATAKGLQFNLYVSHRTVLSATLQNAQNAGLVNVIRVSM
jgi:hypothetical protein